MNTLKKVEQHLYKILTKGSLNYIEKVNNTLYPKPHLDEELDKVIIHKECENIKEKEPKTVFV